jgi:cobalt-precorrin-5B (C1)-methyltransferase
MKSGYTTGAHAASAAKAAAILLFSSKYKISSVTLELPVGFQAEFLIDEAQKHHDFSRIQVTKTHNDDIDVTKECKIVCWLSKNYNLIPYNTHKINHSPIIQEFNGLKIFIYAGSGLGVATKEGLDCKAGFPAINPVSLEMIKQAVEDVMEEYLAEVQELHLVFEVINGEEIAKNTANPKVGILGGISFLGKTGIVKPISSEKYLESLQQEINVALKNPCKILVLTMGNTSFKYAKKTYLLNKECFLEIGNFVFDTFRLIDKDKDLKVILLPSIGKLTKIAHGYKNTNNRYGCVDFNLIQEWLAESEFPQPVLSFCKTSNTVAGLEDFIINHYKDFLDKFHCLLKNKAILNIKNWLQEINSGNLDVEIVLVNNKI